MIGKKYGLEFPYLAKFHSVFRPEFRYSAENYFVSLQRIQGESLQEKHQECASAHTNRVLLTLSSPKDRGGLPKGRCEHCAKNDIAQDVFSLLEVSSDFL